MHLFKAATSCFVIAVICLAVSGIGNATTASASHGSGSAETPEARLQGKGLCAADEQTVFSCPVKRTGKIISLCSSNELGKNTGYIVYRFGLLGKVELEFPRSKENSQKNFYYAHYFRARFDETEISFNSGAYNYRIFDYFDGESRPSTHSQGLIVTPPGTARAGTTLECASMAKADYSALGDALKCDPDSHINPDGCP